MGLEQDFFAGMFAGFLLGVNPLEFVFPCAIVIWITLLKFLPLHGVDTDHTIGGCMFSIFFAVMGTIMCLLAPAFGGIHYSPKVFFVTITGMTLISLHHWSKKISKNLTNSVAKKDLKNA